MFIGLSIRIATLILSSWSGVLDFLAASHLYHSGAWNIEMVEFY